MPKPPIELDSTNQIVLMLEQVSHDTFSVNAIDLHVGAMKIRFSADRQNDLVDVFNRDAAALIRTLSVGALRNRADCDLELGPVEICGVTIRSLSAAISRTDHGVPQIDLRLDATRGNVIALFRITPSSDTGLSLFRSRVLSGPGCHLDSDQLLDDMLSQLYLPLVNLNAFLRQLLDGQLEAPKEALAASVIQLKTKAEVLQFAFDRLLSGMVIDNLAAPPSMPPPEMIEHRV